MSDEAGVVNPTIEKRLVWDGPVRVFHWALVVSVLGAYFTHQLGIQYFVYHLWFGYSVTVLIAFRLLWGVFGTRHARFAQFVRGPRAMVAYLRTHQAVGHNPLGAWMVLLLLAGFAVQAVTGLFANDEILNTGPLYGWTLPETGLALTSLHRQLFYWLLGAVALHILAVVLHRVLYRQDLVTPMVTGTKSATEVPEAEAIAASHWLRAGLILLVVVIALVVLVRSAPLPIGLFDASYL